MPRVILFPVVLLGVAMVCAYGFILAVSNVPKHSAAQTSKTVGVKTPTTPADPTATTAYSVGDSATNLGRAGTLSALSARSITVTNKAGSLTCDVGSKSPKLAGVAVSANVVMYCTNGALSSLTSEG